MLEKDKTYTYEEIKTIIGNAIAKTMVDLENNKKEALKDKQEDNSFNIGYMLHNMMVLSALNCILFKENKED